MNNYSLMNDINFNILKRNKSTLENPSESPQTKFK